jgi:hypothetical protein
MTNIKLSNEELKNLKKMIARHETALKRTEQRLETEGPIVDVYGEPYDLVDAIETHKEALRLFNNLLETHNKTL